jgi:hypothetical protein
MLEVDKVHLVDGIVLNELTFNHYKSKNVSLSRIDADTFKVEKTKNNTPMEHYTWFGYRYRPTKVETILSFDIQFLSHVPTVHDHFFIKTHEPVKIYNDWLSLCVKDEFVHINVKLHLQKRSQLILFMMDEFLGECEFIIKNIRFESSDINYKMISFYTQGEPYDNCINLSNPANRYATLMSEHVDVVRFYRKSELQKNKDTEFLVKEYSNEPKYNACTHLIGYFRWKPYIILDTLKNSNENDIIYYRDSNIDKYPIILNGLERTVENLNVVLNGADIFAPVEHLGIIKMKHHIKREVFEQLDKYPNNYLDEDLINASIIVARKTDTSIKFFTEWLELCNDETLISSDYSSHVQDGEFKWNTQEQSIMNVLMKKYVNRKLLPYKFPFYGLIDRCFEKNSIIKAIRVAVLICGEMRNFDNPELIKRNNQYLFSKYNCDLFISTWDNRGYSPYHVPVENNIIHKYNNVKNMNIENYEAWFSNLPDEYKDKYSLGTVNATVFPQLYKIWDANRMKILYENKHDFKYDMVIRFRPDMCLVEEIPNVYLNEFIRLDSNSNNKIWALNPPTIYYPNRIYDIFFYGNSGSMDTIADSWIHILKYIKDPFDNGLAKVDACRVLYVAALLNNINVIHITRRIGDIYRDESIQEFTSKIQPKKRLAMILCGLHYCENYSHHSNESFFISYQHYFYNIKKSLYNFFENNYDIDTFISTNDSPILNNLLDDYKPLEYIISNESKNNKLLKILELFLLEYNNNYDVLILTRLDIYFLETFIDIDFDKLNIISILEADHLIDDNFYFVPKKYIGNFVIILIEHLKNNSNNKDCLHYLKPKLEECFNMNYLLNEFVEVADLSFFKLRFFNDTEFILNKLDFTKNVSYYSKNNISNLYISESNVVTLTKKYSGTHSYCWIANNIPDPGMYKLSFDIYSNYNIINFDFIKLHKSVTYYQCKDVLAYTWVNINVVIETSQNDDLLCFIFDNFDKPISIQFQHIEMNKLPMVEM